MYIEIEDTVEALAAYPMVEVLVLDLSVEAGLTTDQALSKIRREFDHQGPYHFAKKHGLLINASGEEFAVQWMSFYNKFGIHSYY